MPATVCSSTPPPELPELPSISGLSVSAAERHNVPLDPDTYFPKGRIPILGNPVLENATVNVCEVKVAYSYTGVTDNVTVHVFLPLENWNSRSQVKVAEDYRRVQFGEAGPGSIS